ncbi:MAG TPA: hypothetical protein VHK91_07145, partial [Flavisolibacter sp.]|nr:hypothetical protein [Flavisolibacter sp.]
MKYIVRLLIPGWLFTAGCQNNLVSDSREPLIPKDTTRLLEKKNTLFAFVGEKVYVKYSKEENSDLDNAFHARYKILQSVYGSYDGDEIDFMAYIHGPGPDFSKYRYVLLYVSKDENGYYLEKYQFNDVYPTKNNRWAGRYSYTNGYDDQLNGISQLKPEKIPFRYEITDFPELEYDKAYIKEPYYKIEDGKAQAVYGNYVEDLFL